MSTTNTFINWSGATWTPSGGGSAVPISRVTDCKPSREGQAENFKGDLDVFIRVMAVPSQTRTIEITSGDVKTLAGIAIGSHGAVAITLAEALAGTTTAGGGFTLGLTNCTVTKNTAQGPHGKFAEATITFEGYAPDGVTDPMTIVAL